ncbi:biotin-independent malonate decarboxylase subunit gamma, partial [Burkholderia cenocepacia]|nr:biotin-independent malonate decarboxylase subunit gamma [Burkholderia cenocepacia]
MTLDEVLNSLFPAGHSIARKGGLLTGHAALAGTRVD